MISIHSIRQNTPDIEEIYENAIWTEEEIKEEQRNDALLKHIIKFIEDPSPLNKQSVATHITGFVNSCKSCHVHKGRPHPQILARRYPIPSRPWERVSIDRKAPYVTKW